jgi:hypothetical protein
MSAVLINQEAQKSSRPGKHRVWVLQSQANYPNLFKTSSACRNCIQRPEGGSS